MKVMLVVPNFKWGRWDENTKWHFIPYNLCLLAGVIENEFEVEIVDSNFEDHSREMFSEIVARKRPDVVGITIMMDHYRGTGHEAAAVVKKTDPGIVTVFGGVYATTNTARVLDDRNVDYVVAGEGEEVFRDLLRHLDGRGEFPQKGVWHRRDGKVINAGSAPFIERLDAVPHPAYHLIDFGRYSNYFERNAVDRPPAFPYARIQSSRGCPQSCIFCQVKSIAGRKFRPRSAENVLSEIQWLKEVHAIRSFLIDDDNFFTDRKRAVEILKGLIERGLDLPWKICNAAVFHLDEELLELMKESGCRHFNISIESGTERVLREIVRKPAVKFDHAFRIIRKARELGINTCANFIVGFPGETWDEVRQSLKMAEDIDADYVKIFSATPLPNTDLYELAMKTGSLAEGFDPEKIDWKRGWIRTPEFTVRDMSVLRAYEWDRINFSRPEKRRKIAEMLEISEEELLEIRRRTLDACLIHISPSSG